MTLQKRGGAVLGIGAWMVLLLQLGCGHVSSTAKRAAWVGVGSAAGAGVAYEASNGNAGASVAGAAAGAGATLLLLGEDAVVLQRGFDLGYIQGQSDAIKRQYFLRLEAERKDLIPRTASRVRSYLVPGPEQLPDGQVLEPHYLRLRVSE